MLRSARPACPDAIGDAIGESFNLNPPVVIYRGTWFRRGEVSSPDGLGNPTPTLRHGSLWIDKSTARGDNFLPLMVNNRNKYDY